MKTLSIFAIAGLAAGAALAQSGDTDMASFDTNADGMFTYEELVVALPDLTEEQFATADANGDGMIDADELATAEADGVIKMGGDATAN